jgi:hypothetical protein
VTPFVPKAIKKRLPILFYPSLKHPHHSLQIHSADIVIADVRKILVVELIDEIAIRVKWSTHGGETGCICSKRDRQ